VGCLPYFKFFPSDFIAGVLGLTLEERGAYITFLAWSWDNGPLPLSEEGRARLLAVSVEDLQRLWPALEASWKKGARGFTNKRLESERTKAKKRSESATAAAGSRWS
jgi:uncharacterized protein YdaU (DUF1376 family)